MKRDNFEKENYFHTKNQENIKQELRKIKLERASEEKEERREALG